MSLVLRPARGFRPRRLRPPVARFTPWYGMEPMPWASKHTTFFSSFDHELAIDGTVNIGARAISGSWAWNQLNPSVGSVDLTPVARIASRTPHDRLLALTFSALDYAGGKNLPSGLGSTDFDSSAVQDEADAFLDEVRTVVGPRPVVISWSTEHEAYLGAHTGEITPFATFLTGRHAYARSLPGWGGSYTTASIKWSSIISGAYAGTYGAIKTALDGTGLHGVTFYPIEESGGDIFKILPSYRTLGGIAAQVYADWVAIVTALGGAPLFFTEIGFPDAVSCESSVSHQAEFFASIFGVVNPTVDGLLQAFASQYITGRPCMYGGIMQWRQKTPQWVFPSATGIYWDFLLGIGLNHDVTNARSVTYDLIAAKWGGIDHPKTAYQYGTLPAATIAAIADTTKTAAAGLTLPASVSSAAGAIARSAASSSSLPALTLSAAGVVTRTAVGTLTIPSLAVAGVENAGRTATGAVVLPAVTSGGVCAIIRNVNGSLSLAVPVASGAVTGEELTASGAILLPMPVIQAAAFMTRTAAGAIQLMAPVLSGTVVRIANVAGAIVLEAPTADGQAMLERFVSGDLTIPEAIAAAGGFVGAAHSVRGVRATVTQEGLGAQVTVIGIVAGRVEVES